MPGNEVTREGIVIHLTTLKESDAMVNAIGPEGLFSFYARGINKITSKNLGAVQALSHSKLTLSIGKEGSFTLKEGEAIESFVVSDDLEALAVLNFIMELTAKIVQPDEAPAAYPLSFTKEELVPIYQELATYLNDLTGTNLKSLDYKNSKRWVDMGTLSNRVYQREDNGTMVLRLPRLRRPFQHLDYGPLGAEMKRNIRSMWWKKFVQESPTNVGLDAAILMNPKVWEATGHVSTFNDPMIDCKACKARHRADDLIKAQYPNEDVDNMTFEQMDASSRPTRWSARFAARAISLRSANST
jgi:hypothetical protein